MNYVNLLFTAIVSASSALYADQTNQVYVTQFLSNSIYRPQPDSYHACFYTPEVESRESLPAKSFPEGNWGKPEFGLQISLRLTKPVYKNNEQIPSVVLIRNITNNNVTFFFNNYGYGGGPIYLTVTTKAGQPVKRPKRGPIVNTSPPVDTLAPFMQAKYQEFIEDYYLTNGSYLVHATVDIPFQIKENGKQTMGWHKVNSADVPFEVK